MSRILSILFWSIVAAAFIGPGTVTTAAAAGAAHGYTLLWALAFSILATLVLQEASARITIVSGRNLAEAIRDRFSGGASGVLVLVLVLGAIVLGNAAYETGNLLGAVAGATLGSSLSPRLLTILIAAFASVVLWLGTPRNVAHLLSLTVAFMGVAFIITAFLLRPDAAAVTRGLVVPSMPSGSGLLILGLVGTTVVPYNLFLGSGIAGGQTLADLRFGLTVAVLLGGLISITVLITGASLDGEFSFEALSAMLSGRIGTSAGPLFSWGLFAAGLSSAMTAPLAAAITARSLFEDGSGRWHLKSWRYRSVWGGVILTGLVFALTGVHPIPAIILAQAFNGVLLPFAAIFLFLVVNDREVMGERGSNGPVLNLVTGAVVAVTIVLGSAGVMRAAAATLGMDPPGELALLLVGGAVAAVIFALLIPRLRRRVAAAA